jgi:hypothetical protein
MTLHPALRLALACLALAGCRSPGSTPVPEARADEPPSAAAEGVALVELFTSEGCSSCPPADAVLADLAARQTRGVFLLAFHVDYWDGLGWPDRFASPFAAARQREYARAFGSEGVYTPQMIIGGTDEFTGSNHGRADAAIARALSHPAAAAVRLAVAPRRIGSDALAVDFVAAGAPPGAKLNVAVIQHAASTQVRAGENAGKTLHHANLVRAFVSVPVTAQRGSAQVVLPPSFPRDDGEVIAYLQRVSPETGGMPVLGAVRAIVP